ncbi:hypothetical protein Slala02_09250 [Streptomyces lavendulae subsp. lavendulae]|nr:hypothetical protein Slala01_01290 [Streptomyces lavendulae subsp. lavendulae]GLX25105.1 hypothetical protein Slala02_09250 [Streptomyces lavendulae subsp. lavendulae]
MTSPVEPSGSGERRRGRRHRRRRRDIGLTVNVARLVVGLVGLFTDNPVVRIVQKPLAWLADHFRESE